MYGTMIPAWENTQTPMSRLTVNESESIIGPDEDVTNS